MEVANPAQTNPKLVIKPPIKVTILAVAISDITTHNGPVKETKLTRKAVLLVLLDKCTPLLETIL